MTKNLKATCIFCKVKNYSKNNLFSTILIATKPIANLEEGKEFIPFSLSFSCVYLLPAADAFENAREGWI